MASSGKKSKKDVFAEAVALTGKTRRVKKAKVPVRRFSEEEVEGVLKLMAELQLPLPQDKTEFMAGTEGCIVFINRYGVVLRIEEKTAETDINDNDRVLQPLARFQVGKAVVEICPACAFENDKGRYQELKKSLKESGLKLWDSGLRQLGRIPCKTPEFPEGMTVVVDRGAVRRLDENVKAAKTALQKHFYGPLLKKMAEADTGKGLDAAKVKEFWTQCEEFVRAGKLVAGWNDYKPLSDNQWEYKTPEGPKALQAAKIAEAYAKRFPS